MVLVPARVVAKIKSLNALAILQAELRLAGVARALSDLSVDSALSVLDRLESTAADSEDPTAWVVAQAKHLAECGALAPDAPAETEATEDGLEGTAEDGEVAGADAAVESEHEEMEVELPYDVFEKITQLSDSGLLQGPLEAEVFALEMTKLPQAKMMQALSMLEKRSATVKDPSTWLNGVCTTLQEDSVQRGGRTGDGSAGKKKGPAEQPAAAKAPAWSPLGYVSESALKRIAKLNEKGELKAPLLEGRISGPLALMSEEKQKEVLKMPEIWSEPDPSAWIVNHCRKARKAGGITGNSAIKKSGGDTGGRRRGGVGRNGGGGEGRKGGGGEGRRGGGGDGRKGGGKGGGGKGQVLWRRFERLNTAVYDVLDPSEFWEPLQAAPPEKQGEFFARLQRSGSPADLGRKILCMDGPPPPSWDGPENGGGPEWDANWDDEAPSSKRQKT